MPPSFLLFGNARTLASTSFSFFYLQFFLGLCYNLRLIFFPADNPEAVEGLASVHVDAIAQITRVIRLPSLLLPQESAFIVEMVKKIYAWGADVRTVDHLVSMVSYIHPTHVTHLCSPSIHLTLL